MGIKYKNIRIDQHATFPSQLCIITIYLTCDYPYGCSDSVRPRVRLDPGLVCTELGWLFDMHWLELNISRNAYPVRSCSYSDR